MRHDNTILAVSIAGSMSAGVFLPAVGLVIEPYILVWLAALLFLNLIRLDTRDLLATFTKPRQLLVFSVIKLVALPMGMYFIVYFLYQPFALPVLLLSGISTGLGAPFVVNLIGGRLSIIVGMVISTSLVVPFVLPSIAYILAGSQFEIQMLDMIILLSTALFTPLAALWLTKKYLPVVSDFANEKSFSLSLIFIILINLGIFAKFSNYFFEDQIFLLQTMATAFICYVAYILVGYFSTSGSRSERSGGMVAMSYVNNVLVTVLALQFFGSQVAALAALYNIPYYAGIIALRKFALRQ